MAGSIYVKENDLEPPVEAQLADRKGPADLTGSTVRFIVKSPQGVVKINAAAVIVDALLGLVRYDWILGDTDTPGSYRAEFQVSYPGSRPETFPNDGYIRLIVTEELN